MDTVNVHEAKTRLSQLLERVEQGETIAIARAGTPVALLGPLTPGSAPPSLRGAGRGDRCPGRPSMGGRGSSCGVRGSGPAIKAGLQRPDFAIDPSRLREALLAEEFAELVVDGADAAGVLALPPLHRDPVDRMLLVQARRRGIQLLTRDARLAAYGPGVEVI